MKCLGSGILIPFSRSVALSKIAHLLFATTSTSCYSISINLHCVSALVYTSVVCCTFNCTSMNSCSSFGTTFSSLASFYTICVITKQCSSASSSSTSSMHIGSIDELLVLSALLHVNIVCFCAKNELQMFQLYLYLELLST